MTINFNGCIILQVMKTGVMFASNLRSQSIYEIGYWTLKMFGLKFQIGFRETRPHRGDDFASPLSAFSTISFEGIFPGPRSRRDDDDDISNLSKEDFVGVILDVLKMQKNICLCRHFQVKQAQRSNFIAQLQQARSVHMYGICWKVFK